ncbi:hypothetical protein [Psychrobacter sp. I-STPA6b]|uniref:hypothetical protein n=1 Tax=Psychrobacter sp. I-STPA6b TaxID=2585718 RepID=UPI001D0C3F63|nr:hypothetical protein [Psychrobacter sp. I-STPA6b]
MIHIILLVISIFCIFAALIFFYLSEPKRENFGFITQLSESEQQALKQAEQQGEVLVNTDNTSPNTIQYNLYALMAVMLFIFLADFYLSPVIKNAIKNCVQLLGISIRFWLMLFFMLFFVAMFACLKFKQNKEYQQALATGYLLDEYYRIKGKTIFRRYSQKKIHKIYQNKKIARILSLIALIVFVFNANIYAVSAKNLGTDYSMTQITLRNFVSPSTWRQVNQDIQNACR